MFKVGDGMVCEYTWSLSQNLPTFVRLSFVLYGTVKFGNKPSPST